MAELTLDQKKAIAIASARKRQAEEKLGPLEKFTAISKKARETMTLGFLGDEFNSAVAAIIPGGRDYEGQLEHERSQEERLEKQSPGAALAAEIGGGVLGALAPGGAIGKGVGLAKRALTSTAAGAGMGAAYGFAEGEGGAEDRVKSAGDGAMWGAAGGAVAPAVGAGVSKIADRVVGSRAVKRAVRSGSSASQQRAASGKNYSAFEEAGAEISPQAMGRLREQVVRQLDDSMSKIPGGRALTPGGQMLADAVKAMDDEVQASLVRGEKPAIPLAAIEDLRRLSSDVAQGVDNIGRATRDSRLGGIAVEQIDTFVETLKEADVPIGDPEKAVSALKKARELWSQSRKTQLIENVLDRQDDYLGGEASAIRNGIGSLLRNRKTSRQFTKAEKAILRRIIGGNGLSRAVRLMGNGIGRQAQMAGGAAMGGVPGAIAGVVTGELSSEVANRNAVKAAELARDIVASGALKDLPVAPDAVRQITEEIVRRIGAVGPQ